LKGRKLLETVSHEIQKRENAKGQERSHVKGKEVGVSGDYEAERGKEIMTYAAPSVLERKKKEAKEPVARDSNFWNRWGGGTSGHKSRASLRKKKSPINQRRGRCVVAAKGRRGQNIC